MPTTFRALGTALLLLAGLAIGCSKSETRLLAVPVYPVEGRLFAGGMPAVGAVVSFHPNGNGPLVWATVREDGRFVPNQVDGAIGLPEGPYSLTATWPVNGVDQFAGQHADPSKPIARLTVESRVNLIPTIQLPKPAAADRQE